MRKFDLRGTDYVQGQVSAHIFATENCFSKLLSLPGLTFGLGVGDGAALTVARKTSNVPKHVWRNMLDEFLQRIKKILNNYTCKFGLERMECRNQFS